MKKFLTAAVLFATFVQAGAQSKNFKLGQALEIQSTVLQEVADNYVDTVDFRRMIDKGINAMLGTLDPYTVYFPEEDEETVQMMTTGIYGGVGSLIRKLPGQPVKLVEPYEGSPAVKAGLEPGDEIIAIDGQSILDLTSEQASDRMKGQPATDVRFTVIKGRSGDTVDVTVTRERIHISNVVYAGMIRDSIGYIAIDGFTSNLNEEVRKEFEQLRNQGAKRLVIDLRDNGGGVMEEAIE
ncbi:MAG: S41 family peptidase, partial [Bacteroidales bacterium]|nr:S41 family peptidase [Bacteroidales bacterium]